MLKRLWLILGPLIIAFGLVCLTIFSFPTKLSYSLRQEKSNAVAINDSSFKNGLIKRQALSDPNYHFVPFLALVNGAVWIACTHQYLQNATSAPTDHF